MAGPRRSWVFFQIFLYPSRRPLDLEGSTSIPKTSGEEEAAGRESPRRVHVHSRPKATGRGHVVRPVTEEGEAHEAGYEDAWAAVLATPGSVCIYSSPRDEETDGVVGPFVREGKLGGPGDEETELDGAKLECAEEGGDCTAAAGDEATGGVVGLLVREGKLGGPGDEEAELSGAKPSTLR